MHSSNRPFGVKPEGERQIKPYRTTDIFVRRKVRRTKMSVVQNGREWIVEVKIQILDEND